MIDHFVHFGNVEFTDNAAVRQHITPVNTRVQGFIKEIRFEEFQPVHKGDTLLISKTASFACGWRRRQLTSPTPLPASRPLRRA